MINWQDLINGGFELMGAPFVALSIRRLIKDKKVHGVSWVACLFFNAWGFWNLYYYPHLGQWVSFVGGVAITTANTVWVALLLYYSHKEAKQNGN